MNKANKLESEWVDGGMDIYVWLYLRYKHTVCCVKQKLFQISQFKIKIAFSQCLKDIVKTKCVSCMLN